MTARRSLVPDVPNMDPAHYKFLDTLDKRRLTPIAPVASVASTVSSVSSAAISPVATTAATGTTPYGYTTQAQADAIVAAINSIITRQAAIITAVNQLAAAGQPTDLVNDLKTQFNALLAEMQTRDAMEKT